MKFKDLVSLSEMTSSYIINDKGRALIDKFILFTNSLKKIVNTGGEDKTVTVLSELDTDENLKFFMNKYYKIAKRLSVMTQDGQKEIDATQYTFHDDDEIMKFLDKKEM